MDILGMGLFGWLILSVLFLGGVEALAVIWGKPTISDRVRALGSSAPIVVILSSLIVGYLLAHFWDH